MLATQAKVICVEVVRARETVARAELEKSYSYSDSYRRKATDQATAAPRWASRSAQPKPRRQQPFANDMFIGQHGSWCRRPHSGYTVIFVPFSSGQPAGAPVELLTGFLSEEGNAFGRPIGVVLDHKAGKNGAAHLVIVLALGLLCLTDSVRC